MKREDWGLEGESSRWCRWFGHRWWNSLGRNVVRVHGEPCVRSGCTVSRRNVPKDFQGPPPSMMSGGAL